MRTPLRIRTFDRIHPRVRHAFPTSCRPLACGVFWPPRRIFSLRVCVARKGWPPHTRGGGGGVSGARLRLLCPRALVVASCRRCPRVCPLLPASVWFWSSSRVFLSGLIGCVAVASRVLLARRRSWRFYSAPSRPCSRLWFFFKRRARPSRWATFSGGVSVDVLFVPWLVAAFGHHGVSFRSACVPLFVLSSACLCKPCQT